MTISSNIITLDTTSPKSIIDAQEALVRNGYNIRVDGVLGPKTQAALDDYNNKINTSVVNSHIDRIAKQATIVPIAKSILDVANSYVGQEEISGNLGFKTPFFHKLMVGVGFQKTHPWCSYFAELCWREGYKKALPNRDGIDSIINSLFSASVMQTRNNFVTRGKKYGFEFSNIPTKGSLVIYQSATNKSFGHIGIVESIGNGKFNTIEGNTDKVGSREGVIVAKKTRDLDFKVKTSGLNLIGFIALSDFIDYFEVT